MKKILFPVLALILTACGAAAPQATVTVTIPPTVTFTVTPSFTATPTFTPTPTLTSDQQLALDTTNVALAGVWKIDNGGAVTDINGSAPEGIGYSVEEGLLTYTYMYEGKEITVDLVQNINAPPLEGCVARFDAKCLTNEGKIANVTFSTASGYGYEGDGNTDPESYLLLRSIAEQHLSLSNADLVDMVNRGIPESEFYPGNFTLRFDRADGSAIVREKVTGWFWGDNMIYRLEDNGEYTPLKSAPFKITDLEKYPDIAVTFYNLKDGSGAIMLSDVSLCGSMEENMAWDFEAGEGMPTAWTEFYSLDNLPAFW